MSTTSKLPPSTSTSSPPLPTTTVSSIPLSSSSAQSFSTHHHPLHSTVGRKSPSVISLTSDVTQSVPSSSKNNNNNNNHSETPSQQQQPPNNHHTRNTSSSASSSKFRTHHRTESLSSLYLEAHLEEPQLLENNSATNAPIVGAYNKIHYKIVVLGDAQTGKTSLINRYISNAFERNYTPTVIESFSTSINSNQTDFHLVLWELSSLDSYAEMRPLSYCNVDLFFLCFDVSRPETLRSIKKKWIPEITKHCPDVSFLVVGCKTDLRRIFPSQQTDQKRRSFRKSIIHRTSLNSSPVSTTSTPPKTAKSDSNLSMRELDELSGSMGSDYSFSSSYYDRPLTERPHHRLDITSSSGGVIGASNSMSSMMNGSRGNLSSIGSTSPSSFVKKKNIGLSILNALGKSKESLFTQSPPSSPVNRNSQQVAILNSTTTTNGSNGSSIDIVIDTNEIEIDFSPSKDKQQSPNRSRGYSTRSRSLPIKDWTNHFRHSVSAEQFETEFIQKTPRELFMEGDYDTPSPRDSISLSNNENESVSYLEARKFASKVQACGYIECSAKITLDFKSVINDGFTQFLENRSKKKKSCVVM
ncbi:hypothetical protein FDP41_008287 [Naegleria fowleri]|uniref:Uncharacterized protein n=1 Tax=Naegleria fowleri TaxID=5763 RepID=A0A6A5B3V5_NAEFO|nr:uncharacterized protein FDP41_008287 [Naegleria fowleri]KAF0973583.1 hypothetical protein FDP41_008287 [Naegleria fowleri]CAG4707914.1 unnamed protein product [Naegleria fowleri]